MSLPPIGEIPMTTQRRGEGPQTGGVVGVVGAVSATEAVKLARRCGFYEGPDNPAAYPIIINLRRHKPEIVSLLREERRAVLRHIADNFQSSALGQCALCGGGKREADPFVLVFVGQDRSDLHALCHQAWIAEQEARARVALGVEAPAEISAEHDAS